MSVKERVGMIGLVLMVMAMAAAPAMAGGLMQGDIPSFDSFLQALAGPLVAAAVGIILSVVVEYWPRFEALEPRYKRLAYFGLCMLVPLLAAILRAVLGYVPWSFDPLLWHAIWNGAAAGGVGTLAHARKLPA